MTQRGINWNDMGTSYKRGSCCVRNRRFISTWDNVFGYPESYEIKAFSYGYCDSYVEPDIENQIIFYYENYSGSITGAFPMSEIGKTVFLTREEAEKKLEEMKRWRD